MSGSTKGDVRSVWRRGVCAEPRGAQRAKACCDSGSTTHYLKRSHPLGGFFSFNSLDLTPAKSALVPENFGDFQNTFLDLGEPGDPLPVWSDLVHKNTRVEIEHEVRFEFEHFFIFGGLRF